MTPPRPVPPIATKILLLLQASDLRFLARAGGPALQDVCGIPDPGRWASSPEALGNGIRTHLLISDGSLSSAGLSDLHKLLASCPHHSNDAGFLTVCLCRLAAIRFWLSHPPAP